MVRRGEDTASLMPLVEHHLKMCPDCREEVEALLRILDQDVQK
jgi:predicted anti-sigma-YlaC factor YlaD